MTEKQWFMDDEFDISLPEEVSEEIKRFYGDTVIGIDFAQGLASFIKNTDFTITQKAHV